MQNRSNPRIELGTTCNFGYQPKAGIIPLDQLDFRAFV
jgi:hypothetical protein